MPNSDPFETFCEALALAWGVSECMRAYESFLAARFAVRMIAASASPGVAPDTAQAFRSKLYSAGILEARVKAEHREAARWARVAATARQWGLA